MSEAETQPKPRKRKLKPSSVELRLMAGALLMKTMCEDAPRGCFYVFTDNGRNARADIVERLIRDGKLIARGDGLFAEESQTWAYRATADQ